MQKRDYYEVLMVEKSADGSTLKKAYRKLALEFHPDRNPDDPTAEDKFKEASEAYAVLNDAEKRAIYDRFGHAGLEGRGPGGGGGFQDMGDIFSSFQDIFGDLFGGGGGGGFGGRRQSPNAPARGADLRTEIGLTLEEAAFGVQRELDLRHPTPCDDCHGRGGEVATCTACGGRGQVGQKRGAFVFSSTCPTCRGTGAKVVKACEKCNGRGEQDLERKVRVSIPAGVDTGQTLRLTNQGQAGTRGGPAGHLHVTVVVEPHDRFQRDGYDLVHQLHVSFPEAALGTNIEVPSLKTGDPAVKVKIPKGTQPGDARVVRGAGIPRLDGRGRGDLINVIQVDVPKDLSSKAKKLIEELGRALES
jgi:molecular chaperone DnaJ